MGIPLTPRKREVGPVSKHRKERVPFSPGDMASIASVIIAAITSPLSLFLTIAGDDAPHVVILCKPTYCDEMSRIHDFEWTCLAPETVNPSTASREHSGLEDFGCLRRCEGDSRPDCLWICRRMPLTPLRANPRVASSRSRQAQFAGSVR